MENLLFLGVPILKHIRVHYQVTFEWHSRCSSELFIETCLCVRFYSHGFNLTVSHGKIFYNLCLQPDKFVVGSLLCCIPSFA